MKKIVSVIALCVSSFTLASCAEIEDALSYAESALNEVNQDVPAQDSPENVQDESNEPIILPEQDTIPNMSNGQRVTTTETSGNNLVFYSSVGEAVIDYPDAQVGKITYLPVDNLKRPQGAYGYLTTDMYQPGKEHEDINVDPVGYKGNNQKVLITFDANNDGVIETGKGNPDKSYKGWFYNRSHLIADSLGGSASRENLVTGTRMQNVGWNDSKGGMAYLETKARDYLGAKDPSGNRINAKCPLYYSATPNYVGSETLPRTVTVNAQSCDKTINEQVVVDNTAPGYTINYVTGSFKKK